MTALEAVNLLIIFSIKTKLTQKEKAIMNLKESNQIAMNSFSGQFKTLLGELKALDNEKAQLQKLVEEERAKSKKIIEDLTKVYRLIIDKQKEEIEILEAGR